MIRYVNSKFFFESNLDDAPNEENPGGGIHSKLWNIKRAFPDIEVSSELGDGINLIDPLWANIDNTYESLEESEKKLKENNAFNILWQEELAMFRMSNSQFRFKLIDAVDCIVNCNRYLNNVMRAYITQPMHILYTPIDDKFYKPSETKKKQIVAMGCVGTHKNVDGIIEMFKALPNEFDKIYIGSSLLWGKRKDFSDVGAKLEKKLKNICEWHPELDKRETAEVLSDSWGYVNMSRYDVGCLSFLESAMSACHCFCWDSHPMFDEYHFINRFIGIEDGVQVIVEKYRNNTKMNGSLRNYMKAKHGYEAVRENLKRVLGEVLI